MVAQGAIGQHPDCWYKVLALCRDVACTTAYPVGRAAVLLASAAISQMWRETQRNMTLQTLASVRFPNSRVLPPEP